MDNQPRISILSSVHNERSYIEQTIQSVLGQTYEQWEWIIIDDGSTDGTGELLRDIRDTRVTYIFQANTNNLAKNINRALSMSRGELIAQLDGDDYWPQNKCEIQVRSFEDREVVLSYGECFLINDEGKTIGRIGLPEDESIASNRPTGSALKRLLIDLDCFISNVTVMYRRSSLSDIGGFVEAPGLFPDFSTWVVLSLTGKYLPIPSCLGYYRKHLQSSSFTVNQDDYFEKQVDFLREFYRLHAQSLRDIGFDYDMASLEKHWDHIKAKNRILYRLTLLASRIGVDFVNPLICYMNQKPSLRRVLKRIMQL